jgi:hypothetical protein
MAVLQDADRIQVGGTFQSDVSNARVQFPAGVVKADIQAAIAAIDSWIDSNSASFNAAIPQPVRGAFSSAMKSQMFVAVLKKRYEKGV